MPESKAILGYGIKYDIDDDNTGSTWNPVAEVTNVTPPNEQVDDVEVTHYQSDGKTREFIPGLIDGGECSLEINWIPNDTTGQLLVGLKQSGERRKHRITWPNGVTWTFGAYVKGFEPSSPIDDKLTATVTCKVASSNVEAPAV